MGEIIIIKSNKDDELYDKILKLLQQEKNEITSIYELNTGNKVYGNLTIKVDEHEVLLKDKIVLLNNLEYKTLYFLSEHHNKVISKEQLYNSLWSKDRYNTEQCVVGIICQLRKKLKNDDYDYIHTVIGFGYKFVEIKNIK